MSWGESPQTSVEIILIILVEPALHQPGDRDEGAGDARAEALVLVELHMVGEHLRGLDVGGRGGGGPEPRAFECCARTQSDFDVVAARREQRDLALHIEAGARGAVDGEQPRSAVAVAVRRTGHHYRSSHSVLPADVAYN